MDATILTFLLSPDGRSALDALRETRGTAIHARLTALIAAHGTDRARALMAQDDQRVRAARKTPHAEAMLYEGVALEQATTWAVAAERASRWPGPSESPLVDLTAGQGFDALAAALAGRPVIAYECDPVRAALLRANAEALGLASRFEVREADVRTAPPQAALGFLDPDRRAGTERARNADAFEPPPSAWPELLAGVRTTMVKMPPSLGERDFPEAPYEVVSLGARARERRLFLGDWSDDPRPPRRALSLPTGRCVEGVGEAWPEATAVEEGAWLLDPDPAVLHARVVGDLALRDGLRPTHPEVAYLVGASPSDAAPGTWLHVEACFAASPKAIRKWLRQVDAGPLTLRKRGIDLKVKDLRAKLKTSGRAPVEVVLTKRIDGRWTAYGCRLRSDDSPA